MGYCRDPPKVVTISQGAAGDARGGGSRNFWVGLLARVSRFEFEPGFLPETRAVTPKAATKFDVSRDHHPCWNLYQPTKSELLVGPMLRPIGEVTWQPECGRRSVGEPLLAAER